MKYTSHYIGQNPSIAYSGHVPIATVFLAWYHKSRNKFQLLFEKEGLPMKKVLTVTMDGSPYKKALSLIFALQIRESAFVLLTMRLRSQRIRSTPNSEKIIRQPSLFQHYALIGAQRVGGVGVVTQQFLGIGPAYGQGLGNFPLPQVAENQQLRLAVVPAIG